MRTTVVPPSASRLLRANACYCGAAGAVTLVGSIPLGRAFELPTAVLIVLGAGLLAYAPLLWWWGRAPVARTDLLLATAGDVGWLLGAAVLVAWPDLLNDTARVTLALVTVPVAVLALLEAGALRTQSASARAVTVAS